MVVLTQSDTTESILQCVAIQEHFLLAGQILKTWNMRMWNTDKIDHHNTGKEIGTLPEDLQLLPIKHTPYPVTLQAHLTQETDNITFSSKTHPFQEQDHHDTTTYGSYSLQKIAHQHISNFKQFLHSVHTYHFISLL